MKVWPIDPLVPRNLRLEVPEKLPQGLTRSRHIGTRHYLLHALARLLFRFGSLEPMCIRYVPGFETWEQFVENGLH